MFSRSKPFAAYFFAVLSLFITACQSDSSHNQHAQQAADAATTVVSAKDDSVKAWSVSATSKNKHFDGTLRCQQAPFVGDFQDCYLTLMQSGKAVEDALLAIDGGMKAHGHGLPTQPQLTPADDGSGRYSVDGLKFSMTGAWTIGFLINVEETSDQLIFDFSI